MLRPLNVFVLTQSKNDTDGALNKYKLVEMEHQFGPEIWNNVGLCFAKKRKFIAVRAAHCPVEENAFHFQ